MDKDLRQKLIIKIINNKKIGTQKDLTNELQKHGVESTQATISRDIKELKLIKIQDKKSGTHYAVLNESMKPANEIIKKIVSLAILDMYNYKGNIIIELVEDTADICTSYIKSLKLVSVKAILSSNANLLLLIDPADKTDEIMKLIRKSLR